jgi:hypothetical protein
MAPGRVLDNFVSRLIVAPVGAARHIMRLPTTALQDTRFFTYHLLVDEAEAVVF